MVIIKNFTINSKNKYKVLSTKDNAEGIVMDSIYSTVYLNQKLESLSLAEERQAVADYIKGYSMEEITEQTGKTEDEVIRLLNLLL